MSAFASHRPTANAARTPRAYLAIAATLAGAAQVGFVAIFAVSERAAARADLAPSPDGEMAVAIDAVSDLPLLKYGAEKPSTRPAHPAARATRATDAPGAVAAPVPTITPDPTEPAPTPPDPTEPAPAPTSGATEPASGPELAEGGPAAASTTLGSALGSDAGTESDPLKARAAAGYRSQLDGWFSARFHIRGKLPFERLEKLAAAVVVSVSDRRVVSFALSAASGDPVFDAQLRSDLNAIQASGVELPAPPPTHPELLGATVSLRFACSIRAYCE